MLLVFAVEISMYFGMVWPIVRGRGKWYFGAIGICCKNKYIFWYILVYG